MNGVPTEAAPQPTRKWSQRSYWLMTIVIGLSLIVRLSVRDFFPWLATLFYATPLGVLIGLTLWQVFLARRLIAYRWHWRAWLALCAVLTVWWWQTSWFHHAPSPPSGNPHAEFTALFWNVARQDDLTAAADYIRSVDADLVGLVEVVGGPNKRREFWNSALPEYDVSVLGAGMYLLAKGTSGETTAYDLTKDSRVRELDVTLQGHTVKCLIADIESHPLVHRGPALTKLHDLMTAAQDQPLLVMGDFNTPTDSIFFDNYREGHKLVFEDVGTGYAPTFPLFLPLLTLDQLWVNHHLQPVDCQHGFCTASDHRPVLATIRFSNK